MTMRISLAGLSNKEKKGTRYHWRRSSQKVPGTFFLHSPLAGLSSITILLLLVFLAITGRVVISMVDAGHQSYSAHLESTQAFYVADAGLEWVNKAITFDSGSAEITEEFDNLHFDVTNNSGATVTVTGLTASWTWGTTPADTTQFYQEVRIHDPPTYNNAQVWDYGTDRAGNREAVTFNTGPTVTLSNGTSYEFRLRKFKNDETGGPSAGNMSTARLRVAFNFTPNSISLGRGSFVISVPTISSGNALYASTATIGSASRRVQAASLIYAEF